MYAAFEDNDLLYLVLELCEGGDLYRRLKLGSRGGPTRLTEDEAAKFVIGPLLAALIYLHRRGIIHRDIKPENICVASNNQIKVIDFGLAINANKEKPVTRLGTLEYIAPEVIICPEKVLPEEYKECKELWYSESCDIWGCGILASELMTGYAPFEKDESEGICRQDQFQDFKHHLLQDDPEIPSHLSLTAASFIKLALTKDPASRPAASELIHHPFLQPYHEAIQLQLADHVSRTISCPQMHATEPISIQRLMAASGNASSPVGSPQMKNFMHSPLSSSLGHLHEDLASAMPQLKDVPSQSCPLGYSSVHRSMSRLSVAEGNKGNLTGLMLTTPLTQPDM